MNNSSLPFRPAVSIDFDGVIHQHVSPWTTAEEIHDPPVEGAFDFLRELHKAGFEIQILSARANSPGAEAAMIKWFQAHGLEFQILDALSISSIKRGALLYIDDRGWQFNGIFPTLEQIRAFKPWYEDKA
jgi:hypothetical protein